MVTRSTKDLVKAAVSGWMGTAMEFMDFQLYSLAAAIVFNKIFFPNVSPAIGLIAAFATYGVGYVARLVGAIYFGRMGDRIGRKKVLFITIALMGLSTTLIGVLPTYDAVGIWAPILLVALRLVQGFGAGAEIAGATVMLVEYAPVKRRGIIASLVSLGTNSGTLAASAIWALLLSVLTEEQLLSWGWRIPFLLSFILLGFALWLRANLKESPVFEERAGRRRRCRTDPARAGGKGGRHPRECPRGRPEATQGQGVLHRPRSAVRPGRQLRTDPDLPGRLHRQHPADQQVRRHRSHRLRLVGRLHHHPGRRPARRPFRPPPDLHRPVPA